MKPTSSMYIKVLYNGQRKSSSPSGAFVLGTIDFTFCKVYNLFIWNETHPPPCTYIVFEQMVREHLTQVCTLQAPEWQAIK
jgi:hypothetical protein